MVINTKREMTTLFVYLVIIPFIFLLNLLINLFILGIVRYNLLRASSYLPISKELKHRGALVNEKKFLWSALTLVHEARDNPNRVINYRTFEITINMNEICYPVMLRDIDRFENLNENISVNALAYEEKKIFPVRITNAKGRQNPVNPLVITEIENHHFILIKNLNRLLVMQYKKYNE